MNSPNIFSYLRSYRIFFPILLLIIAILLRFYQLGNSSLWHDEAFTHWRINRPLVDLLWLLRYDGGNLPLYYLLVKPMIIIFGDSEFGLRMLSASLGVLAILFALKIGDEISGQVGAFSAGIFLVFHPMAIWYS
jgi:uncharacterized membrane protein